MEVNLTAQEVMEMANTLIGRGTGSSVGASQLLRNSDFLFLDMIMYEQPETEQTSLSERTDGDTYTYVWDYVGKRVLLRVSSGGLIHEGDTYKYYVSWNSRPTGLASYDIDKLTRFFYTTTDKFLTIWHWSLQAGNLVPTGTEYQPEEQGTGFEPVDVTPVDDEPDEPVNPDEYDYASDPQYPEHYGAHGDATEYYDWPLVCFGGIVDDNITIDGGTSDIEVYAPGERIYYKYGMTVDYFGKSLDYTTSDVLYSSVSKKFVLKANNKYYDKWENSDAWNDPNTGKARTDTLYSDIEELAPSEKTSLDPNDEYGLCRRRTYIFHSNEMQDLFNQDSTQGTVFLHNDGPALSDWFDANKGAGKTAKLAPGRIYYICSKKEGGNEVNLFAGQTMFKCVSNTTVIGNGATIFARMTSIGWPPKRMTENFKQQSHTSAITIFSLNNCSNVTIKGTKFKSLKDRDANAPNGSNSRFSSSSSGVTALSCGLTRSAVVNGEVKVKKGEYETTNIVIEDIECKNISAPLNFSHGTNFAIKNVTATGVVNQGFGLAHSTYENVHMVMAPYIGSAMHLFYGGCYAQDVDVRDSSFKTVDPYTEVMITMHGGTSVLGSAISAPNIGETAEVRFHSCEFEGGGHQIGGDGDSAGRLHMVFNNCIFTQLFDKGLSSLYYGYYNTTSGGAITGSGPQYNYVINAKKSSWEFNDCEAIIKEGVFMNGGQYQLIINGFKIYSGRDTTSPFTLFGRKAGGSAFSGTVSVKGFYTDFPGYYGFDYIVPSLPDDSVTIPEYEAAPLTPSVGERYRNTTDDKVYQCTALGKGTQIAIQLNDDMNGSPYTVTHVVTFNEQESITFDFADVSTLEALKSRIASVLTQAGYTEDSASNVKSGIGKWCFYLSGSTYLDIASKSQGNYRSTVAVSNMGSSAPFKKINTGWGKNAYQNSEGTNPVWEEMSIESNAGNATTPLT